MNKIYAEQDERRVRCISNETDLDKMIGENTNKKFNKRLLILAAVLLLLLTGCSDKTADITTQESHEASDDIYTITRSETILLEMAVDLKELGIEYYDDAVELYQDAGLECKIYCRYDVDKDNHVMSLYPPENPLLNVSTALVEKLSLQDYEHSDYALFDKGAGNDWGNLGKMYLVKWMDLTTGEKLSEPEITKVFVKGELDTPGNLQFDISEYGNGILSWDPVEGAKWYLVVKATYRTDELRGYYESCDIVAETKETAWQSDKEWGTQNFGFYDEDKEYNENEGYYYGVIAIDGSGTSMISNMIPLKSMAERLPMSLEEKGIDGEDVRVRYAQSIGLLSRYQWVKMCDGSMKQYPITYQVDEAQIVTVSDEDDVQESLDDSSDMSDDHMLDNVDDGLTDEYEMDDDKHELSYVDQGTNGDKKAVYDVEDDTVEMLQIPYSVDGTEFDGHFYVEEFDRNTYRDELKEFKERQDILKSKMSGTLGDISISVRSEADKETENVADEETKDEVGDNNGSYSSSEGVSEYGMEDAENVTATNELSRYIAEALLKGKEYIYVSLSGNIDKDSIIDAFYEAYFQNPLIPAITKIDLSEEGDELAVEYADEENERKRKQSAVAKQVELVASELLDEHMSDADKVLAINAYLCDTVDYDERYAKLQTSDEGTGDVNKQTDSEMNREYNGKANDTADSSTAYGALINHKGICGAYAESFKLLADEMELPCIVVTGTLNGTQKHVWNKVKIDGHWCVVDVTTNDREDMGNIALNLSDDTADHMLTGDDRYMYGDNYEQYKADTEIYEYYHMNGSYYSVQKIADAFAQELTVSKQAVLRTETELDNAGFQEIVHEVMEQMGDVKLKGYYRLGVVYLERVSDDRY